MLSRRTALSLVASLILIMSASGTLLSAADKPAGFGATARGGTGGRHIQVTTLADHGPGSLRAALEASEPRIVTFAVGGTIHLEQPLVVRHGRLTLDGSTAPDPGVTITRHGIWFLDASSDIILRHLRVRATTGGGNGDGFLFNGIHERILIDHCSLMWATDENLDTWGRVKDLTCQWTLLAEGQRYGDHAKGRHSMGWLGGRNNDRFTIHHCLFAHNGDRNPLLCRGRFDLVNNVIYNWNGGSNATKFFDGVQANVVHCTFIAGAESGGGGVIWLNPREPKSKVYVEGNVTPFAPTGREDPRLSVQEAEFPASAAVISSTRFAAPQVETQSAQEAFEQVLDRVGPGRRDADEERILVEVRERTGHVGRRNEEVDAGDRLQGAFPQRELDALAESFAGRLGFFVKDLQGGAVYGWQADGRFPAASVIKLPVMLQLYRQAAAGKLQLDETRPLPDDISTHGSGVLKDRAGTVELALREYCRLMMVHSDNMATDLVIRAVGKEAANVFLAAQGCQQTRVSWELGRWHYHILGMEEFPISRENDALLLSRIQRDQFASDGLGYADSLQNNVCGPRDTAVLLERLYLGQLANQRDTQEMLAMLRASTHKQTIGKYLLPEIVVANKYGGSRRIAADAGIVELPNRPLVVAAFTLSDDASDRAGREILARMARLAIAAIDPAAVKPL